MIRFDPDLVIARWRGPVLAALIAMLAGLPTLFMAPILDRHEARTALSTVEWVSVRPASEAADRVAPSPSPLTQAMQGVAVRLFSDVEDRDIRPYRLPSLFGAALAAWACAWGASALWGSRIGFLCGALLGATYLLSTLAGVATAQALGAGLIGLMMAALAQVYALTRAQTPPPRPLKFLFWAGLGGSILTVGLTGVLIAFLTTVTLAVWDRDTAFLRRLGWGWGLPLLALIVGPWIITATVASDGGIWRQLFLDTPMGRIASGDADWSLPGGHLLVAPLLLFPATLMAPAALMTGLRRHAEPGVRFAVAWLTPAWILFEVSPEGHWAQTLPLFAPAIWLAGAALTRPLGRVSRLVGVALAVVGGVYVLGAALFALSEFGGDASRAWATPTIGLTLAAAGVGGFLLFHHMPVSAILTSIALGILAHASLAGVVRTLEPLSVSPRLARAMVKTGLHPVEGKYPGPVAVAGYEQPSAVFLLGDGTQLTEARGAAEAIAEGRPAVVDERLDPAFRAALDATGASARRAGEVRGFNYVNGEDVALTLYAPETAPR